MSDNELRPYGERLWINCGPRDDFQSKLVEFAAYCHDQGIEFKLDNVTSQYLDGAVYQGVRLSERSAVIVRMRFDALNFDSYSDLCAANVARREAERAKRALDHDDKGAAIGGAVMLLAIGLLMVIGFITVLSWITGTTWSETFHGVSLVTVALLTVAMIVRGVKWCTGKLRGASA